MRGWVEQGVLRPSVRATGKGTRRRFTKLDLARGLIIAECQRLLGSNFRPGTFKDEATVAGRLSRLKPSEFEGALLDLSRLDKDPLIFFAVLENGRALMTAFGSTATAPPILQSAPVVLVVNIRLIGERLRKAIDATR